MTAPDVLYQATSPALDGLQAAIQAAVTVGSPGVPVRVDTDVAEATLTAPMVLLERGGPAYRGESMTDRPDVVVVSVLATCIGSSVDQADRLRGRVVQAVTKRLGSGGWEQALTVTGFRVVHREVPDGYLPDPVFGGGWANAVAPLVLWLQPVS